MDARGIRNALPRVLEGAVLGPVANHERPRDAHNIPNTPLLFPHWAYDAPPRFSAHALVQREPRYELPEVSERCALHVKSEKPCRSLRVSDNANRLSPHRTCAYSATETRRIERRACRLT